MSKEQRTWWMHENKGEKIFAVLHRPPLQECPLVIIMHGFASHKVGTGRSWVKLAEGLAEAGIAALRFDFRGCGDSEGNLSQMTFEDLVEDGLSIAEKISEEGFSSIGFFGSSLGGAIATHVAERFSSTAALALWAPVASGELWVSDFLAKNPAARENPVGALSTFRGVKLHPLFQQQFSTMRAYDALGQLSDIPFLHMQGTEDEVLSQEHQKLLKKVRERARASSEFLIYPETGHWIGLSKQLPQMVQDCTQWFKKSLPVSQSVM